MSKHVALLLFFVLPLSSWSSLVSADKDKVEDRVSFQVEAGKDVENDRVVATLSATAENRDPAKLAKRINSDMQWAVQQLKNNAVIKMQSGSYQTYPVYDDKKIVRWRSRQDLQLESAEVGVLSKMLGGLQERLQIQSLQFSVSPEKRSSVESALIEEALAAFSQRAEVISRALGTQDYGLVDLTIHTGGVRQPLAMRAEAASLHSRSVAAPTIEQGTSRINVQVSGRIQLQRE